MSSNSIARGVVNIPDTWARWRVVPFNNDRVCVKREGTIRGIHNTEHYRHEGHIVLFRFKSEAERTAARLNATGA